MSCVELALNNSNNSPNIHPRHESLADNYIHSRTLQGPTAAREFPPSLGNWWCGDLATKVPKQPG